MSCYYCVLDLSGATSTLPCCANVVHTACLIAEISNKITSYCAFVECQCNIKLWEEQAYDYYPENAVIETRVTSLLAQPGVQQELKELKKATTTMTKAHRAFGSYINGLKAHYKEQSAQHIIALKQLRDTTKSSIVQSAEYKAQRKLLNVLSRLQNKFRAKHNLTSREYRRMIGFTPGNIPRWACRYYTSLRVIRRLLRIII